MTVPNVDENRQWETDLQLWLIRPDTPAAESYERPLRDVFGVRVEYGDGSGHNAMRFSTFKDSPGAHQLSGDWEIAVRWWDPRVRAWLEPPNSRFVITGSKENMVDESNQIEYSCVGTTWLLEKVRVRVADKFNTAWRLNRDEERAKDAYDEAEREFNSAFRSYESRAKRLQEDIWGDMGISLGPILVYERGLAWLIRNRVAKWRSLVWNPNTTNLLWFSSDTGGWRGLGFTSRVERSEINDVRTLARTAYNQKRRMERARNAYAAASRANREGSSGGTRFFYNRTPARVLWQLWREGQERDAGYVNHGESTPGWADSPYPMQTHTLKGLWRGWTQTRDARGKLWINTTTRQNWELRLGQSLWSVLQDFRDRGEIDWRVGGPAPGGGGRSLYLVPYGSLEVDQSRRVAMRLDDSVTEAPETVSRTEHQSVTLVLDSSGINRYTYWGRDAAANQTPWGVWEGSINESNADSLETALALTNTERQERSRRYVVDASRRMTVNPGAAIPMLDFEPHHLVTVFDHEGSDSVRKVASIIVEKTGGADPITATIQLGTRRTSRRVSYARTMNKILGETDHIQGHIPLDPRLQESDIPADALYAPALTSIDARVRFDEDGRAEVMLAAQLSPHDIRPPEDAEAFDASDEGQELIDETEGEGV